MQNLNQCANKTLSDNSMMEWCKRWPTLMTFCD